MITKNLIQKLTAFGYTDCKVEAKRNVPGTGTRKADTPEYTSSKLSEDQPKDFQKRADDVLSKFEKKLRKKKTHTKPRSS